MNSFEILKVLLTKLEAYEQQSTSKDNLSLEEFYDFIKPNDTLIDDVKNNMLTDKPYQGDNHPLHIENNVDRIISQHILFLYRYVKFYSKYALEGLQIRTIEEFGFLVTVMHHQSISKSELIKRNVMEKSSGIEIINRLIKNNLLKQYDNPQDKRSQFIALTEKGKMELFKSFEKMNLLGKISAGKLDNSEKEVLAMLLKKLDDFHYHNYMNKDIDKLEDYLP